MAYNRKVPMMETSGTTEPDSEVNEAYDSLSFFEWCAWLVDRAFKQHGHTPQQWQGGDDVSKASGISEGSSIDRGEGGNQ